ncbi:hypothetical protein ACHAQI_007177 [Fusarium lateritium]
MFAKVLSALFFLTAVTANLHDNCACHNGDSHNWRMTIDACTEYNDAGYEEQCVQATTEDKLAGDQWEDACRKVAQKGFGCADGKGTCYANPDDVRGRC